MHRKAEAKTFLKYKEKEQWWNIKGLTGKYRWGENRKTKLKDRENGGQTKSSKI